MDRNNSLSKDLQTLRSATAAIEMRQIEKCNEKASD